MMNMNTWFLIKERIYTKLYKWAHPYSAFAVQRLIYHHILKSFRILCDIQKLLLVALEMAVSACFNFHIIPRISLRYLQYSLWDYRQPPLAQSELHLRQGWEASHRTEGFQTQEQKLWSFLRPPLSLWCPCRNGR